MTDTPPLTVGIDLGTTFSALAYLDRHGRPVTVVNSEGSLITPSVVFFDEGQVIVGREAQRAGLFQPDRVVECIKREMGNPSWKKAFGGVAYTPEMISGLVLMKLKKDAEAQLGPILRAVITVPAYFDDGRRAATEAAGRIAGLEVVDILNEPSAAALTFSVKDVWGGEVKGAAEELGKGGETVLVYDLGGGTFDVSLVRVERGKFRVLATDGDVRLGGRDWDQRIVDRVADRFREEKGVDPRSDPQALQSLREEAERAKLALSAKREARVPIQCGGHRTLVKIERTQFEEWTRDLLAQTRATSELVVREAGMKWDAIHRVLLVGGSTRMPMVREMLRSVTGKEPDQSLPADEVVAQGAAIHAAIHAVKNQPGAASYFEEDILEVLENVQQVNVNSHTLGMLALDKTGARKNSFIIPKNSPLPCAVSKVFRTQKDSQREFKVKILEGESADPASCLALGECQVELPARLPAKSPVEITYSYTASGRVHIEARDLARGTGIRAELVRSEGLKSEEVEREADRMKTIEIV
ncbi:MAG: Hsp70 family protein [Planctomycetes bacterium]|nr:Hsp70 family protein [Planctomycetota bacterium]